MWRRRARCRGGQGRARGPARRPWRNPASGVSVSSIRAHRRSDFLRFDNRLAGKHIRSELECLVELSIVEDTNCGLLAQCPCDDRKSPGSVLPIRIFVASHEEASGLAGGALYFDMAFGPSLREDEIEPTITSRQRPSKVASLYQPTIWTPLRLGCFARQTTVQPVWSGCLGACTSIWGGT